VHKARYGESLVAVKQMLQPVDREAAMLASLQHRNIVRLIGACTDKPHFCLVTELAPHGSLFKYIQTHEYSSADVLNWLLQIVQGMDYLHEGARMPILHRDLKAANVLVFDGMVLKLCDFGASRPFSQDTMMSLAGTVSWLAPEVLRHERVSKKCDVYRCVWCVCVWCVMVCDGVCDGV
jgi:serine/threonine protein kinase